MLPSDGFGAPCSWTSTTCTSGYSGSTPPLQRSSLVHPARWLAALEHGGDAEGEFTRRFLVRSCYLNPAAFASFRPNFTRAGFRVVDCPSLTQQGKSSADINLVLDAVDAFNGPTRYDEFMILSADADFTPLALRFRAADRRVTIVTASPGGECIPVGGRHGDHRGRARRDGSSWGDGGRAGAVPTADGRRRGAAPAARPSVSQPKNAESGSDGGKASRATCRRSSARSSR